MTEYVYGGVNMTRKQVVDFLKFAIVATDVQDDYSSGLRNGMRLAISCLTDENPNFEKLENRRDELPSVEPKKGKWMGSVCSECGNSTSFYYDCDYCPNCGARMDAERKEE